MINPPNFQALKVKLCQAMLTPEQASRMNDALRDLMAVRLFLCFVVGGCFIVSLLGGGAQFVGKESRSLYSAIVHLSPHGAVDSKQRCVIDVRC